MRDENQISYFGRQFWWKSGDHVLEHANLCGDTLGGELAFDMTESYHRIGSQIVWKGRSIGEVEDEGSLLVAMSALLKGKML